jgi:nucleoside-diphosphate-sugar epimerase
MKNKRAFVTGGNGFVGSYLIKHLTDHGIETTAFILKETDCKLLKLINPNLENVTIIEGDVCDKESFREHINGMNFVFHLAGIVQGYDQDDYDRVNIEGTKNILELCAEDIPNPERLVILSSTAAAGSGTRENPLTEESEAQPIEGDYYGISKLKMEKLAKIFSDDLPITIVRPSSVLGPGNHLNRDMYKTLKRRLKITLNGPYRPLSFIDVRDLAEGIYLCAIHPKAINETFHFANDEILSYNELLDLASQAMFNKKSKRMIRISTSSMILRLIGGFAETFNRLRNKPAPFINRTKVLAVLAPGQVASSEKAKRILGWKTKWDLASTIAQECEWNKVQGLI